MVRECQVCRKGRAADVSFQVAFNDWRVRPVGRTTVIVDQDGPGVAVEDYVTMVDLLVCERCALTRRKPMRLNVTHVD